MKHESELEKMQRREQQSPWYRRLTIIFLATTVVFAALSLFIGLRFRDYKKSIVGTETVNLVMDIKWPKNWEGPVEDFNDEDYGGPQISNQWYGRKLIDYLNSNQNFKNLFTIQTNGMITAVKSISANESFWWQIQSFHRGVNVGILDLLLTQNNYFSFVYTPMW